MDSSGSYNFVENPGKIVWSQDMAHKFENILQSPEYKTQFNEFLSSKISNCQNVIDIAASKLSELLVDGAILAQLSSKPAINRQIKITAGSRRNNKRKVVQPKWP